MKDTQAPQIRRRLIQTGLGLTLGLALTPQGWAKAKRGLPDWLRQDAFDQFLEHATQLGGLPRTWVLRQFDKAERQDKALALANPEPNPNAPARSLRRRLASNLTPKVIEDGRQYLRLHQASFQKAESRFGVPSHILCAILGIETRYGKILGRFPAVDTLASLGFASPRRQDYFRSELLALLQMGHRGEIALEGLRGSFAGALGIPQFMPSNWGRFGEDLDGNGRLDLVSSPADAIGSVGRFLHAHGWINGQPTHTVLSEAQRSLVLDPALNSRFVTHGLKPLDTVGLLGGLGLVTPDADFPPDALASVVMLPEVDNEGPAWMAGQNFFSICQYNRSYLYAASVILLGQALQS
ncbi:MltB Membrane-bound lytic murein transglycosylase B [Burkholderiales bacterium]